MKGFVRKIEQLRLMISCSLRCYTGWSLLYLHTSVAQLMQAVYLCCLHAIILVAFCPFLAHPWSTPLHQWLNMMKSHKGTDQASQGWTACSVPMAELQAVSGCMRGFDLSCTKQKTSDKGSQECKYTSMTRYDKYRSLEFLLCLWVVGRRTPPGHGVLCLEDIQTTCLNSKTRKPMPPATGPSLHSASPLLLGWLRCPWAFAPKHDQLV